MAFKLAIRKPEDCPRTRSELLGHLWALGLDCNVFKEGPFYAVTARCKEGTTVIGATHTRCINDRTFGGWEQFVRTVPTPIHLLPQR